MVPHSSSHFLVRGVCLQGSSWGHRPGAYEKTPNKQETDFSRLAIDVSEYMRQPTITHLLPNEISTPGFNFGQKKDEEG